MARLGKQLFGGWSTPVKEVTANYTVKPRDCGSILTNRGATGTVTFTLPKAVANLKGFVVDFYTVAAQSIVVASDPTDILILHADAAADSITTAATIGQHIQCICDGTGWLVVSDPSAASAATAVTAVTIAT